MQTKKYKIAVIAEANIYEQQGMFNAILNRTKYLAQIYDSTIEILLLSSYDSFIVRRLRGTPKREKLTEKTIDGIKFKIFWKSYSLIKHFITVILHRGFPIKDDRISIILNYIKGYDFIVSHSLLAGEIAMEANRQWNIPFSVTWHGSDIHTLPMNNVSTLERTKLVIESANINYFVSRALRNKSNDITHDGNKEILYNGCDTRFYKYPESQRNKLRQLFNVKDKKVVTFVGNFLDIKNILIIPKIFGKIYEREKNIMFWMFGDGKYRADVESMCGSLPIKLWGNIQSTEIPKYLNCTDVQILPSKNEGLPLTMVEALKCGCHAVGSLVGGIPEVIGEENCISLDNENFIEEFANRVLYFLKDTTAQNQELKSCFDWNVTAEKEMSIINNLIVL